MTNQRKKHQLPEVRVGDRVMAGVYDTRTRRPTTAPATVTADPVPFEAIVGGWNAYVPVTFDDPHYSDRQMTYLRDCAPITNQSPTG